jgi:hypothetical protein
MTYISGVSLRKSITLWGSQSGKDDDAVFNAMWSCRQILTFREKKPTASVISASQERRYVPTSLHGVTTQNNIVIFYVLFSNT